MPRDRHGELGLVIVKKHQSNVTGIEDQMIALYAKAISIRDMHVDRGARADEGVCQ